MNDITQAEIEKLIANKLKKNQYAREYMRRYSKENPEQAAKYRANYYKSKNEVDPDYYKVKSRESYERRAKVVYECPCGGVINRPSISKHIKSKKHSDYIKTNPEAQMPWSSS